METFGSFPLNTKNFSATLPAIYDDYEVSIFSVWQNSQGYFSF